MDPGNLAEDEGLWPITSVYLILPITATLGLKGLVLLLSCASVWLETWSLEGAMRNLIQGFPALFGIGSLWAFVLAPASTLARRRSSFLPVATGLIVCLMLSVRSFLGWINSESELFVQFDSFIALAFITAIPASVANLSLLIEARNELGWKPVPIPVNDRYLPGHHARRTSIRLHEPAQSRR